MALGPVIHTAIILLFSSAPASVNFQKYVNLKTVERGQRKSAVVGIVCACS